MIIDLTYLESSDIYLEVMERHVMQARRSVWIATANVKNVGLRGKRGRLSFVGLLERLVRKRVEVRILHASKPSRPFQNRFSHSKLPASQFFHIQQCPRLHMKAVIVDHAWGYLGSANLTNAGMGYRDERLRNFEIGIGFHDRALIERVESFFEFIWTGELCRDCGRRNICPKPIV